MEYGFEEGVEQRMRLEGWIVCKVMNCGLVRTCRKTCSRTPVTQDV
jgi:hypothetical protein